MTVDIEQLFSHYMNLTVFMYKKNSNTYLTYFMSCNDDPKENVCECIYKPEKNLKLDICICGCYVF